LLDAIAGPKHERHAELTEWVETTSIPMSTRLKLSSQQLPLSQNPGRGNLSAKVHNRITAAFTGCLPYFSFDTPLLRV
jgi:hypothetical protein